MANTIYSWKYGGIVSAVVQKVAHADTGLGFVAGHDQRATMNNVIVVAPLKRGKASSVNEATTGQCAEP